jgi:hypothetical protein
VVRRGEATLKPRARSEGAEREGRWRPDEEEEAGEDGGDT